MKKNIILPIAFIIVFVLGIGVGYGLSVVMSLRSLQSIHLPSQSSTESGTSGGTSNTSTGTGSPLLSKPITISTASLSSAQRAGLAALGITGDSITITPAMAECVSGHLGLPRTKEIIAGASPSASEIVQVVPCLK